MTLRLSFLGAPYVAVGGRQVEFDTRKAVALLAYLAVTGQPQTREALAALLWPEYDAEHARSALRRTLSTARRALDGRWLEPGRQSIRLERADVDLDVERFRRLVARPDNAALDDAVRLVRGDFLAGFALRDSVEFDDWQLGQAEELRRELALGLERLSRSLLSEGEHRRAIDEARRWLGLDTLSEPAHAWLMELYARSGDRVAAIRQYRDCVRVLDQELGVPPLPETSALYEAIVADRLPPLPEGTPRPAPRPTEPQRPLAWPTGASPLVGRAGEVEALTRAYEQIANADAGAIILIEGEPGIGKTRLAQELVVVATRRGAPAVSVRCHEGEQRLAYAPWVDALRRAIEARGVSLPEEVELQLLAEATLLAPELRSRWPELPLPLAGPGAQARLLEAVTRIVSAALTDGAPGVLVIDDLQWADAASLDLLAYLARRLGGRRICVVVCRRPEAIHDARQTDRLFAELAQRGALVIRPGRLDRTDIGRLVAAVGAPPSLVDRLMAETEGVPYFVVEYLAALAGPDAAAAGSVPVPRGVRGLLRSRIRAVDQTARQLLAAAAVIGRSFDPELARETSGRNEEETVSALEELMARGLIRESAPPARPKYDFTHDQLRQLVYEETSLPRRRLLHRRAAEALARRIRRPHGDGMAAVVARHYQAGGEERAAAEWYRLAGDASRRVHANDEALSHYRAALALAPDDQAGLHEAIGDVETLAGRYKAALADFEAAVALAPAEQTATLEHKIGNVHQRRGAWVQAESHFDRALELLGEDDSGTRARITADLSLNAYRQGDQALATKRARVAMELAERASDLVAVAQVHNLLGMLASSRHHRSSAIRHLRESLRLADQLSDAGARVASLNNLALAERELGNLERAMELTRSALEECMRQGDRHREAALHNNLADLLHRDGRREEAMEELKQAVAIFADIGHIDRAAEPQPEIWKLVEW